MATEWLIVGPAYAAVYQSVEGIQKDWDAGKDFKIQPTGPYMSKRDVEKNTMDIKTEYLGVRIVQSKTFRTQPDGRLYRIPYLTVEITW